MADTAETILMGEVDRFVMPAGEAGIARFCAERLLAPHNVRERLRRALLLALPREAVPRLLLRRTWPLRLRPAGDPEPPEQGSRPNAGLANVKAERTKPQAYETEPKADRNPTKTDERRPQALETGRQGPETERLPETGPPAHGTGRRRSAIELVGRALGRGGLLDAVALPRGRPVRWLLVEDYADRERERLVVFLFGPGEESPTAVLKLRRTGGAGPPLAREERALARLAGQLPADLAETVPRVLAYQAAGSAAASGNFEALLISALPGTSAYAEMQGLLAPGRAVDRHFALAAVWLARFHSATRLAGRAFDPGSAAGELAAELSRRGISCDLSWRGELVRALAGSPLPLAAGHGDFWARNLLVERHRDTARVVDWEHAVEAAPPFDDLFQFPLAYGLNYPWTRWRRLPPRQAFSRTFLEDNRLSRAVATYLRRYAGGAGLPHAALAPLFHLHLLTRSLRPRTGAGAEEDTSWIDFHRMLAAAGRSVFSG